VEPSRLGPFDHPGRLGRQRLRPWLGLGYHPRLRERSERNEQQAQEVPRHLGGHGPMLPPPHLGRALLVLVAIITALLPGPGNGAVPDRLSQGPAGRDAVAGEEPLGLLPERPARTTASPVR